MAEDYEPYHVPQQSRRDKLRVVALGQSQPGSRSSTCIENFQAPTGLVMPLYDPSLISSDLLTCANLHVHHTLGVVDGLDPKSSSSNNQACYDVKEGSANLIGYVGGRASCSSSSTLQQPYHLYLDSQSSLHSNPSPIQDANSNSQFFFTAASHNLRRLDHHQPFSGGEVVVYKPEPLSISGHHQLNNATVQGLSLSLSSHHTNKTNLPLELNLQKYESPAMFHDKIASGCVVPGIGGGALVTNDLSRSSVPLGPFTGYASILKGSRFLKPAQQLLEELCDVGRGIYAERVAAAPDSALMDPPRECVSASGVVDESTSSGDGGERRRKKSRLISMLDEVYRRYKYYYQQMQAVVASFESVAGLSNAAPFANLALKAMSKHFRCLKNAITDQLQFATKSQGHITYGKDDTSRFGNPDAGPHSQRAIHGSGFIQHQPVWRPQRGLPERAVTVLRAWLFEHFLHPYPTDTDKLMLAKQTGLSRNQVSNWFINARVRLWKPMVEEIHMLETRQAHRASQKEEKNVSRQNDDLLAANSLASENQSNSPRGIHPLSTVCTRNDFPDIPMGTDEPINLSYNNLNVLRHATLGGVGVSTARASGGVSLTLGLHQNNGIGLSEPFSIPMNAARRFGLDTNSEGYVVAGIGTETRQFGGIGTETRQFGRSVVGSQLLQDFVG